MNTLNDLTDARLYAGLLTKIGDILTRLTDNDTGVLCAHKRAKSECPMGWR